MERPMPSPLTAEQNLATGATSLADLMGKRLDAYLPTLQTDTMRRRFLQAHLKAFQEQARDVLYRGDKAPFVPGFGYPKAVDYHGAISEISARLDKLTERVPA